MCKEKDESEPRFQRGRSDARERTLPSGACGKSSGTLGRAELGISVCAVRPKKASESIAWVGMGRKIWVGGLDICLSFK